jgi:hypothetical protein
VTVLDRPSPQLARLDRQREIKRARDRRHRQRRAAGVVVVSIPVDSEIVCWLRRTQWLTGPCEGPAELADALTRLLADAVRR